ncbi:MAG: hypothetical protein CMM01_16395 [Rhodopirellula sp.]|nr:hypothetical protein [Rhodopirellula sp.]
MAREHGRSTTETTVSRSKTTLKVEDVNRTITQSKPHNIRAPMLPVPAHELRFLKPEKRSSSTFDTARLPARRNQPEAREN